MRKHTVAELLTKREAEVLPFLLLRVPIETVAVSIGVKPKTVKWYITNIYKKAEVKNRKGLIEIFTARPPAPKLGLPQGNSRVTL